MIVENYTQNVPGFLFNKGRGRTEFRRIAQLDDTTVVIGGNSIHLGRGSKNFANADLTLTGDRVHNGTSHDLTLQDFDGIDMFSNANDGMYSTEMAVWGGFYVNDKLNGSPYSGNMFLEQNNFAVNF